MNIRDLKAINVLNHNNNVVIVSTKNDTYKMLESRDGLPSILPLTFDEIQYINANSEAFKTGILRFQEDLEEEIYNELKISNWREILTLDEIKSIIINPTVEGLKRILDIKNVANFERVKGVFVHLKNMNKEHISIKVEELINKRDVELRRGVRNTEILVEKRDTEKSVSQEDILSVKEQNMALQKQLLEMQKMMTQMMNNQNNSMNVITEATTEKEKTSTASEKKTTKSKTK